MPRFPLIASRETCADLLLVIVALPVILLLLATPAFGRKKNKVARDHEALALLQRANNLMDIRLPGSAPFQMKVTFEALPAMEFPRDLRHSGDWKAESAHPRPGHPWVITGNGAYEETWLSPHRWRREVTFGSYHAVEVEANGVRKFQASSSYEPLRVLMLVGRLLQPIRRLNLEPQLQRHPPKWKMRKVVLNGAAEQRISYHSMTLGPENFDFVPESYTFLPDGALARSEADELTTTWQGYASFGGKLVPRRISVSAMEHVLLTAEIRISAPGGEMPSDFTLSGPPANPGMPLRPISSQYLALGKLVRVETSQYQSVGGTPPGTDIYVQTTFDLRGAVREYEVLAVWPLPKRGHPLLSAQRQEARHMLTLASTELSRPTTIDGYPCEVLSRLTLTGSPNLAPIGFSP